MKAKRLTWTQTRRKPKYVLCFALSLLTLFANPSQAANVGSSQPGSLLLTDDKMVEPALRESLIRRAEVWFAPSWIDANGNFDPHFDPRKLPLKNDLERAFLNPSVDCVFVFTKASTGANPKFHCDLAKWSIVKPPGSQFKVKYGAQNGEVYGEVLATRLLWSLGFGADREFFVPRLVCAGCGPDPVHQTAASAETTTFEPVAIEKKFGGTELIKKDPASPRPSPGWGFEELTLRSNDAATAARQTRDREALLLLTMFINHLDNRRANQRLVCVHGWTGSDCAGPVAMILQDVGSTFGRGYEPKINDLVKVDFDAWKAKPIWDDISTCTASVSPWGSQNLKSARILESGRVFLLSLLRGFSADRSRVEALFSTVAIEKRGGHTAREWADVFLSKVDEIAKAKCR